MMSDEQIAYLKALWDSSASIGHIDAGLNGNPPLSSYMEEEPYEGQEKIVSYLRHAGFYWAIGMNGGGIKCDGDFSWISGLADTVEKHNLRLEPEFERAVLGDPKRMTRFYRSLLDHGIHTWGLKWRL